MAKSKIEDGKIILPDEVIKNSNFKDGREVNIEVVEPDELEITLSEVEEKRAFERRKVQSRETLEEFLKKVGFSPSKDNPDVWVRLEQRKTATGKYIGTVYEERVNIPTLLEDDNSLRTFVRRHSKALEK
jgi:antitoxin component of MazEF toxin-antitoxin module